MISLSLVTAMVAEFAGTKNQAGNAMGVLFTFCFITCYGGGIDVVSYVYCSMSCFPQSCQYCFVINTPIGEIYPTQFRSQGMAWSIVGTFLSTLAYVEAAPTALANIQWRYYLIFIGLTFINIIVLWWWCPEVSRPDPNILEQPANPAPTVQTKGLSLEEINGKFGDEVVVHFADATEKEREALQNAMVNEERMGSV